MKTNHIYLYLPLILFACVTNLAHAQEKPVIKYDDTRKVNWPTDFNVVEIPSSIDNEIQKAYFYKSTLKKPQPLIVSLHTWSGDYAQRDDDIAKFSKEQNVNYIHPNFRGANNTASACCSEKVMGDIDDAITYAMKNAPVDPDRIYVMGVSGGGYATLSTFMKSKHKIAKFSSWAPITDLVAWYNESKMRRAKYADDILKCTSSPVWALNDSIAKLKSPIYWKVPKEKLEYAEVSIYEGIYDGIQGSVPITHAINFYNKLLKDLAVSDSTRYVSDWEKLQLLEFRRPLGDFGYIQGRKVCLAKQYGNIKLVLFDGNHEMLPQYAFNEILGIEDQVRNEAEEIVKVSVSPAYEYNYAIMKEGAQQHLDRAYTYDVIPPDLNNGYLFQGIHRPPAGTKVTLDVKQRATIYFFFHNTVDGGYSEIFPHLKKWKQSDTAPQYDIHNGDHGLKMIQYELDAKPGVYEIPETITENACFSIVFKKD